MKQWLRISQISKFDPFCLSIQRGGGAGFARQICDLWIWRISQPAFCLSSCLLAMYQSLSSRAWSLKFSWVVSLWMSQVCSEKEVIWQKEGEEKIENFELKAKAVVFTILLLASWYWMRDKGDLRESRERGTLPDEIEIEQKQGWNDSKMKTFHHS